MNTILSKRNFRVWAIGLLTAAVIGAGCVTKSLPGEDAVTGDVAVPSRENFRPVAEQRFRAFTDALDRGDTRAVRSLLSIKQPDPDLVYALSRHDMRAIAAWLRTYEYGGIWDDRVEFRPTQHPPGETVTSLYVHFTPGKVGITY